MTACQRKGPTCENARATAAAFDSGHTGSGAATCPRAGLCRAVSVGDGGRTRTRHGPGRTYGLWTRRAFPLARGTAGVLRPGAERDARQAAIGAVAEAVP